MGQAYDDNQTLQQKIMNGVNKLTDNVASTLGPRGRNVLLQETDWMSFSDSPTMSSTWKTYRQSLRDITKDIDTVVKASDITWPTKPE